MCHTDKVGQGHPDDTVCNDFVRPINLPNMNAVRKFIWVTRTYNRKLGQASLTDFHKVKVICVGEDDNNTLKSTRFTCRFHSYRYSF